jgi:hypothetical protein
MKPVHNQVGARGRASWSQDVPYTRCVTEISGLLRLMTVRTKLKSDPNCTRARLNHLQTRPSANPIATSHAHVLLRSCQFQAVRDSRTNIVVRVQVVVEAFPGLLFTAWHEVAVAVPRLAYITVPGPG